MHISSRSGPRPGHIIFTISGEIDLYTFPPFIDGVLDALQTGKSRILVDMTAVDYLDSSGVGGIIRLSQEARRHNARLAFRGIGGMPLKVLSMSHILSILETLQTEAEADAFFRN